MQILNDLIPIIKNRKIKTSNVYCYYDNGGVRYDVDIHDPKLKDVRVLHSSIYDRNVSYFSLGDYSCADTTELGIDICLDSRGCCKALKRKYWDKRNRKWVNYV